MLIRRFAVLLLISVFVAPHIGAAQFQLPLGPPAWTQLTIVHVEPAMVDEYISLQRDISARTKRGGPAWRIVSRTEVFGDTYQFAVISPLQNFASFDTIKPDPELAALTSRAQKYVTGQQSYAIRNIPELDNPLPDKQQPNLILVNVARVLPGREQDYLKLMKSDFLPHFDKANFHHVNGSLTFGGEAGFIHLFYVQNFAKLDEGSPVMKELGAIGAQAVTAKLAGIVTSTEQWITRVIPELSYGPWSAAPPTKP